MNIFERFRKGCFRFRMSLYRWSLEWKRMSISEYLKMKWLQLKYQVSGNWLWLKCRVWNAGILLLWNRLWIRRDEFHPSLDQDLCAMMVMSEKRRERYIKDLMCRRQIAHERDLCSRSLEE